MFRNFDEMLEKAQKLPKSSISVAAADDIDVLKSIKDAAEKGLVDPLLVGNRKKIEELSSQIGLKISKEHIIDISNPIEAAEEAVKLVRNGDADIIMKGMVTSSDFMKAVLSSDYGLRSGKIISHLAAYDIPNFGRVLFLTDGGINIAPDLNQKVEILQNAVDALVNLGFTEPKVAVLSAVEFVNPHMEATIHGAALSKMAERGQIRHAVIDGPFALDNAINLEAAKHKGIYGPVAGNADILLVPNIESGNILGKSIIYFAKGVMAGIVLGAAAPIVLTSRAETAYGKLCSIAMASMSRGIE
ncbi:MAG TPA: bifunctional enoyl-CoA hydratase/phosphate acetyltransferase [Thermoanaerobacterales bacterium]|nr:bifunctional enoyl-CoA hydratase/phosphate acetyltransferase [Thermoanaerobacterales bacterium]